MFKDEQRSENVHFEKMKTEIEWKKDKEKERRTEQNKRNKEKFVKI